MPTNLLNAEHKIYTVSELNRQVRVLLESQYPLLWLAGEISNLSRPISGHLYFSLKDRQSQIRCALFRNRSQHSHRTLANGQQVLVRARISLYEPRGDYQLIIEYLEDAGEGALRQAFEELRQRLDEEGLFAVAKKKKIPLLAKRIAVITSASGAAISDVLSILKRRFPSIPVLLYPTTVQGMNAANDIANAITLASKRRECDVILLIRGGGSLEDLNAFNSERVARAIANCQLPIVSGVGHETDVTIADFVADVRAPTPSAAAEIVSPDRTDFLYKQRQINLRVQQAMQRRLQTHKQMLDQLCQYLNRQHPGQHLQQQQQLLKQRSLQLQHLLSHKQTTSQHRLHELSTRLLLRNPALKLSAQHNIRKSLSARLAATTRFLLTQKRQQLTGLARTLQGLSPLATLDRGYAILYNSKGQIISQQKQVQVDDEIEAQVSDGRFICQIKEIQS